MRASRKQEHITVTIHEREHNNINKDSTNGDAGRNSNE